MVLRGRCGVSVICVLGGECDGLWMSVTSRVSEMADMPVMAELPVMFGIDSLYSRGQWGRGRMYETPKRQVRPRLRGRYEEHDFLPICRDDHSSTANI